MILAPVPGLAVCLSVAALNATLTAETFTSVSAARLSAGVAELRIETSSSSNAKRQHALSAQSDESLRETIQGHVAKRLGDAIDVPARGENRGRVAVAVENGIVVLRGTVSSLAHKDVADDVASTLRGVRSVVNQIEVVAARRPDEEIVADVRERLASEPATRDLDFDVSARDGVITLAGEAVTFAEKILAGRAVSETPGVRDVDNRLRIEPAQKRSDADLAAEVRGRLDLDAWLDASSIRSEVESATVALSGVVGSVEEKLRAIDAAWVVGVERVVADQLVVDPEASVGAPLRRERLPRFPDPRIALAIRDALRYDPRVLSSNLDVEVRDGAVILEGWVLSRAAKRAALEDAENTIGVWRVEDRVRVRPATDPALDKKVREQIERHAALADSSIQVSGDLGTITLRGRTRGSFEKELAEELASRVEGVVDVDNRIEVDTMRPAHERLEERVERQLFWSPFVDASAIEVSIEGGAVVLTGTVPSLAARRVAIKNAHDGGAKSVVDRLVIENNPSNLVQGESER